MQSIQLMYSELRRKFEDRFKRFCRPLRELLKINHFYHFRLTHAGEYAVVGLHTEWEERFFSSNQYLVTPYFRHPRFVENGMILQQTLNDAKFSLVLDWKRRENSRST